MRVPAQAFTSKSNNGLLPDLRSKIHITAAGEERKMPPKEEWTALWDTGATGSVISRPIIDSLQLQPVSMQRVASVQGEYDTPCYYVDFWLPNHVIISNVLVTEGKPYGVHALIGMDIIHSGDFAVSNFEGKTSFSFRIPSLGSIDFVNSTYRTPEKKAAAPARNDPCPCNSGKKYKNCCGSNK